MSGAQKVTLRSDAAIELQN